MKIIKANKSFIKSLVKVTDKRQIKKKYLHKGFYNQFYEHDLDQYSIVDIDKFIAKGLIFIPVS